jgi:tRNA-uridine 2-sulfurtransferase
LKMDMKKKLENAYNPDKQTRKEKVVVGLSGGIDSYVTAYLLKIQKYELFAVTVVNAWDDYPSDSSEILSCHVNQQKIDELKEFCQKMGIPLQVVKATGEFKENVIEPWLADRATGRLPKQCWNCHEERMQIIYNKMVEAGATRMATGHYAKLFHHEAHGSVFVHTSNDEVNDQSALLSRLPHEILSSLILPLSDLSKKEVLKLAENFGAGAQNLRKFT